MPFPWANLSQNKRYLRSWAARPHPCAFASPLVRATGTPFEVKSAPLAPTAQEHARTPHDPIYRLF